ncbi:MAG: hypothetical protein FD143_3665, partial [Ignavibacteria bacterium]
MSEQQLKDNGFIVIKKTYYMIGVIIIIVGLIGNIFAQKAIAENMLDNHEIRISKLEEENKSERDLLIELKFNIKSMMEKQGLTY